MEGSIMDDSNGKSKFLSHLIADLEAKSNQLTNVDEKLKYLKQEYVKHDIRFQLYCTTFPISCGPIVVLFPEELTLTSNLSFSKGYLIVITTTNTYAAVKQICLGAVITVYGPEILDEYEKLSSSVDSFLNKYPHIKHHYEGLLHVFFNEE